MLIEIFILDSQQSIHICVSIVVQYVKKILSQTWF